jgi:hypothetical protein
MVFAFFCKIVSHREAHMSKISKNRIKTMQTRIDVSLLSCLAIPPKLQNAYAYELTYGYIIANLQNK